MTGLGRSRGQVSLRGGTIRWAGGAIRREWNGRPGYSIAPSQRAPVIRVEHGLPVITELRWGLVSSSSKDEKIAYSLINARSETVAEKSAFRSAFKKRRCLIPADVSTNGTRSAPS